MPTLNWDQIRREISSYTDLNKLKTELSRLKEDISKLKVRDFLSPASEKKLKRLEAKYGDVLKSVHRAQRQLDREVNRFMRKLKTHRQDAEKKLESFYDLAMAQKSWFANMVKPKKKTVRKKKTTRKKTSSK
jgi:hypothetical protein